jgi:hypothetical protein
MPNFSPLEQIIPRIGGPQFPPTATDSGRGLPQSKTWRGDRNPKLFQHELDAFVLNFSYFRS